MRIRDLRFATVVVVVALCGFAVASGWSAMSYAIISARAGSGPNKAEMLGSWVGTAGVGSLAREAILQKAVDPRDRNGAAAEIEREVQLLAVRPLSPQIWLSMAVMRMIAGVTTDKVEGALLMSSLTGPNEGHIMMPRGIFGLSLWDALRPEVRKSAITDVAAPGAVGTMFSAQEWVNFRTSLTAVIASKSPNVQREILAGLLEGNLLRETDLQRLGLRRE